MWMKSLYKNIIFILVCIFLLVVITGGLRLILKEICYEQTIIQPEVVYVNNGFSEEDKEIITKFIDVSLNNDFDWKLTVAVAQLESILCKSMAGQNNCFGLTNGRGDFLDFESKEDSAVYFIDLLKTNRHYREFQQSGKVDDLFRYAEDKNWVQKIKFLMDNL